MSNIKPAPFERPPDILLSEDKFRRYLDAHEIEYGDHYIDDSFDAVFDAVRELIKDNYITKIK